MASETVDLVGEEMAYEANWYRVLKAVSLGQEIPNLDPAFSVLSSAPAR